MRLYLNSTSPFARVARIAALERQLPLELCWVDPWADPPELLALNPLGRIPLLVTDSGECIAEALLIVLQLDTLGSQPPLLPAAGRARVLQLTGLGMGLMEAAFACVIARKLQDPAADQTLLGQRRLRAIERSLQALESDWAQAPAGPFSLGELCIGVALDYLDLRLGELDWQRRFPATQAARQRLLQRESFRQTAFA